MVIGILAIQGSFREHAEMIKKLGVEAQFVRSASDLDSINGLILPGGESTTMDKLAEDFDLKGILIEKIQHGLPVYGTCAGMILLAKWGLLDIEIERNAYGSQLDSFEANVDLVDTSVSSAKTLPGVFIRAPRVTSIGDDVITLATHNDSPVLIRQNNILASSFHPELTQSTDIHQHFLTFYKD